MTFTDDEVKKAKSRDLKIWVIGTREEDFTKNNTSCPLYSKYNIDISKYSEIYQKFVTTKEYDEENINQYSKFFNEFVGMYYVWKNNKKSKYVGFCHYRRVIPLSFVDYDELDKNKIQYFSVFYKNQSENSILLKDILNHKYTYLYERCCTIFANIPCLYDDIENYLDSQTIVNQDSLKDLYPINKNLGAHNFISRNIFVCKWEEFDKMMKFLSGYVEYILKCHNINSENDFITFYKNNIIHYLIKNWNIFPSKGYRYFIVKHNMYEYISLKTYENCGYKYIGVSAYWRVFAYIIELLTSCYISLHTNTDSRIIECHNMNREDYNLNSYIYKIIENEMPNNILIFNKRIYLEKILNYYKIIKNKDVIINFISIKTNNFNKKHQSVEEKYLINFRKNNTIDEKNISLLNNVDFIILDESMNNDKIINNSLIENNLNKLHCTIIVYGKSIDKYKEFFDKLKSKYNIIKNQHIAYHNISIITLYKKGEV